MTESKDLMKMLYLELSGNPPPTAVLKVFIHAEPVEPRRTQHGLFAPASPEAEKLETTLARVRHFVGKENVGSPYLLNTHRADRFVMHRVLTAADCWYGTHGAGTPALPASLSSAIHCSGAT